MKNILGTTENLTLYNKEGKGIYEFKDSNGYGYEYTYDSNGKELTYKDSNGYGYEYTYDSNGKELTYKDSDGITRGFDIPEFTMEELVQKLGNFIQKNMKNIHLIPTDKSSGLCINGKNGQNICITSNEEIKANVYCLINGVLCKTELLNDKIVSRQLSGGATMDICKSEYSEIILTTDQDLINDGVQAIDDEFLEWFVKNPSCEEVEIIKQELNTDYKSNWEQKFYYKIIIPKEEPKQETTLKEFLLQLRNTPMTFVPKEEYIKCGDCNKHYLCTTCGAQCGSEGHFIESTKQETTLEEAAEKFAINIQTKAGTISRENAIEWFKAGAKWQSTRMYTEKDLRDAYNNGMFAVTSGRNFKDWFTNYKSK